MSALLVVLEGELHVVAQVVEAEFVVLAVGDVGEVGIALHALGLVRNDHATAQAQEAIYPTHPLRIAGGEVVVDRDDVHTVAGQGIQHRRTGGDQGFAFAGLHL